MTRNLFALWVLATMLLAPLHGLTLQTAGMGMVDCAVGAAFLYADRNKPRPLMRAVVAVVLFSALMLIGSRT